MTTQNLHLKRYRIVLDVSEDMKTEFAAAAAIKKEKMNWVLLKFIRAYIGKERAELDRLIETYRDKGAIS